jgi:hypothetical protein
MHWFVWIVLAPFFAFGLIGGLTLLLSAGTNGSLGSIFAPMIPASGLALGRFFARNEGKFLLDLLRRTVEGSVPSATRPTSDR